MNSVIIIQDIFGGFDVAVQVERTPEVMEKVNTVSRFINNLPLPRRENDAFVELLTNMVNTIEHEAYLQGLVFGKCWLEQANDK